VPDNKIIIEVESEDRTKAGFDEAKASAELAGEEAGAGFMARLAASMSPSGPSGGITGLFSAGGPVGGALMSGGIGAIIGVPLIAAAVVEIGALTTALVAATAGIGSLALVALPTFEKIKNAYTAISTAQAAYNTAAEKQKLDPTAANARAVATALLNLKVAEAQAGPAATQAIAGIDGLKSAFGRMADAMQPQIMQLFNTALGIAAQLLPVIARFAQAAAPAVQSIMTSLSKQIDSKGFKDFVDHMTKLSPAAITAIATGIGKIVVALGKMSEGFSAKDITQAVGIVVNTLTFLIGIIGRVQNSWDRLSGGIREAWANIIQWGNNALEWFVTIEPRVKSYLEGLGPALQSIGEHAIEMLANGLIAGSGSVVAAMFRIGGEILDHLPHSPAKKGPLSGSGSPDIAGRRITQMLATGMTDGLGAVSAASSRMAGAAGLHPGGGVAAGGGGVQVSFTGGGAAQFQQFVRMIWPDLMLEVRNRGGGGTNSVQVALGQSH
jgi:hypothetical protein